MNKSWLLAGAFDAGHIRGWTPNWKHELNFHQLEFTGHAEQLEADYQLLREEFGLALFRDGAWLARTWPVPATVDWTYLDRLASLSHGQVVLSLCHYEWLPWITTADIWSGRVVELMANFAGRVALRYQHCFAGYIPLVESGYWTAMMTQWRRWWPAGPTQSVASWWQLYAIVGRMKIAMACAIRAVDEDTPILLSEPWNFDPQLSLDDQARPFRTLLGQPDSVAVRETGGDAWGGSPRLLNTVGLNFYVDHGAEHGWPLSRLLLEARRRFPEQAIMLGETSNCRSTHCHGVASWLALIDAEVQRANAQGARITTVMWAPILTLGDFEWGDPAPGAWVTWDPADPRRRRQWDRDVAAVVRAYTG